MTKKIWMTLIGVATIATGFVVFNQKTNAQNATTQTTKITHNNLTIEAAKEEGIPDASVLPNQSKKIKLVSAKKLGDKDGGFFHGKIEVNGVVYDADTDPDGATIEEMEQALAK